MEQANASVKDKIRGRLGTGDTVIEVGDMNIRIVSIAVSTHQPTHLSS